MSSALTNRRAAVRAVKTWASKGETRMRTIKNRASVISRKKAISDSDAGSLSEMGDYAQEEVFYNLFDAIEQLYKVFYQNPL